MDFGRKVYSGGPPVATGYHLGCIEDTISEAHKPELAVPHKGVAYTDIKNDCQAREVLFEDPDFPADNSSLYFSKDPPVEFEWKRPHEIVSDPSLFIDGASRFDITQGMLGDCWLLAAIAALCENQSLLHQVVPEDQSFEDDYCGLFRFRFWQYGRWEEVVVDDRLPTYNDNLMFLHSSDNNEFWSALLEKAYAKLCGTYEALNGGHSAESMEDFTGGVTETFDLKNQPPNLFKVIIKAKERQSLTCAAINAKPDEIEAKLDNGLIMGHAYTITAAKAVNIDTDDGMQEFELLRIRNPWGNEREWNGKWSDGSSEWDLVSEEEKEDIGLKYEHDGEFWMSFEDFSECFSKLEICMLSPDAAGDISSKCWEMRIHQGTWQKYVSAGGCRNFPETFHLNPQYRIKLEDPDDDDDEDNCTIVIGLIQKDRRKQKVLGTQNLTIGFAVYKLDDDADQFIRNNRVASDYFLYNRSFARSDAFTNSREVTGRYSFPPGRYVIIPSTFNRDEEGDFVLRIFSEKAHESQCMDTHTQIEIKTKKLGAEDADEFDSKYKDIFNEVTGEDGEVDPFELQTLVNDVLTEEMGEREFSIDACRSMLSMVDRNRNGKLNYDEFADLLRTITEWKNSFVAHEKDEDGDLNALELRGALANLGFMLNTPSLSSIVLRWAKRNGGISLEDYIQICCRVKSSFVTYLSYQGRAFTLNNFIMQAIYI